MTAPESGPHVIPTQTKEWGAALALLPVAATLGIYALPASLQEQTARAIRATDRRLPRLRLMGRTQR